jgi:hypothetical protein
LDEWRGYKGKTFVISHYMIMTYQRRHGVDENWMNGEAIKEKHL